MDRYGELIAEQLSSLENLSSSSSTGLAVSSPAPLELTALPPTDSIWCKAVVPARHLTIHSCAMLHRQFPASVTQATICSYFWAGIAAGILQYQSGKNWAFSIIEVLDVPPIEIIDIATANDRNSAMDALQAASKGADQQTAGRLLLADVHHQLTVGDISALKAIRAAMHVAQIAGLPIGIYIEFDRLDDELQPSVDRVYGTPETVKSDVLDTLVKYSGAA